MVTARQLAIGFAFASCGVPPPTTAPGGPVLGSSIAALEAAPRPDYLEVEPFALAADGGDWALAIERALASEACGPGCALRLRRFTYDLKTQIDVCKPVLIYGVHTLRTQLRVTTGTTAIQFRFAHWCGLRGLGTGAEGSTISDLTVKEISRPAKVKPRVGIGVSAPITVRDVRVDGFYRGLEVDAGAKRGGWSVCATNADCPTNSVCSSKRCRSAYATNANTIYVANLRVNGTDGAAIYLDGPDANAGTLAGVIVKGACFRPIAGDDCAGVFEGSFLGNYWSGLHVAQSRELAGAFRSGVICDGDDNRSTFVGTYLEEDVLPGRLGQGCEAIGGKSHWSTGGGLVINARTITMPVIVAPTIKSRPLSTTKPTNLLRWEVSSASNGAESHWIVDYDGQLKPDGTPLNPNTYRWLETKWKGGPSVENWKEGTRR